MFHKLTRKGLRIPSSCRRHKKLAFKSILKKTYLNEISKQISSSYGSIEVFIMKIDKMEFVPVGAKLQICISQSCLFVEELIEAK